MEYTYIPAKTIIRKCSPNRDYLYVDYAMDLYRGCNHGCIYCYARSDYYEKTDNFASIRVKENALRILRDELMKIQQKGVINDGCVADPYNILEKDLMLTRHALELMNAFEFGVCIITKSDLVARDADVLQDVMTGAPAFVNFSITCADDEMSKKVEPGAPVTSKRLEALETLTKAGVHAGVLMDPMLPYLTDTEENVREMVKKAKQHGAEYIYLSTMVTMTDIQREYYIKEAEKLSPGITETLRTKYKEYYRCKCPKGRKLYQTFVEACEQEGINCDMRLANRKIRRGYNIFEKNLIGDTAWQYSDYDSINSDVPVEDNKPQWDSDTEQ